MITPRMIIFTRFLCQANAAWRTYTYIFGLHGSHGTGGKSQTDYQLPDKMEYIWKEAMPDATVFKDPTMDKPRPLIAPQVQGSLVIDNISYRNKPI